MHINCFPPHSFLIMCDLNSHVEMRTRLGGVTSCKSMDMGEPFSSYTFSGLVIV